MYSRRFYGTDRAQRARPAQSSPQNTPEKVRVIEKNDRNTSDTFPRWAVNIPVTDGGYDIQREYPNPRDFLPEKENSENYIVPRAKRDEVSVYPESSPMPPTPEAEPPESAQTDENLPANSNIYSDISSSMKNMTLEDMMLAGLLMLGSSGDYDDEIMLILGLILMIGA